MAAFLLIRWMHVPLWTSRSGPLRVARDRRAVLLPGTESVQNDQQFFAGLQFFSFCVG